MNKAFTKETDDADDEDTLEPLNALPPGTKNYITKSGFESLKAEFNTLLHVLRPKVVEVVSWAAGNGDRSENGDYIYGKKKLGEIDRRLRFLTKRIESVTVVDSDQQKNLTKVFFGATVTYCDTHGESRTLTIVGIDEANLEKNRVSWISPIARAMMKAGEGDIVEVRTPTGKETIEIVNIRYGENEDRS